jgi:hypothetical protein
MAPSVQLLVIAGHILTKHRANFVFAESFSSILPEIFQTIANTTWHRRTNLPECDNNLA